MHKNIIILYPEYYLLILLLPYQAWGLLIVIYPFIPKAQQLLQLDQLYYVSTEGELILIGNSKKHFSYSMFSIITCGLGKSVLIIHYKQVVFCEERFTSSNQSIQS